MVPILLPLFPRVLEELVMRRLVIGLVLGIALVSLAMPAEGTVRRWGWRRSNGMPQVEWVPAPTAALAPSAAQPPLAAQARRAAPPPAVTAQGAARGKSLYERLGGEAAIKAVVDDFVGRAAGNPKVNFTRKGTDKQWDATPENVARLKMHLVDLIGMGTGGPQKYTGRSMKESHTGMKITAEEFGALAADLKATLDKFKVPMKEQMELLKFVGSTQADIVEVK
jgi:hemoglobin